MGRAGSRLTQDAGVLPARSDSESKTSIVKVIRSILRENFRRHIKSELPSEKVCKERPGPLKNRVPVSAKLGENLPASCAFTNTELLCTDTCSFARRKSPPCELPGVSGSSTQTHPVAPVSPRLPSRTAPGLRGLWDVSPHSPPVSREPSKARFFHFLPVSKVST